MIEAIEYQVWSRLGKKETFSLVFDSPDRGPAFQSAREWELLGAEVQIHKQDPASITKVLYRS